jgi:hypothetical protein
MNPYKLVYPILELGFTHIEVNGDSAIVVSVLTKMVAVVA